jgi:hypothetical protein
MQTKEGDTMALEYNVTIHLEVLREGFAELLSDIRRFKDFVGVATMDQRHPLAIFEKQVIGLYHGILGSGYNTMADVQELKGQLNFARAYMREMETEYAGELQRTGA